MIMHGFQQASNRITICPHALLRLRIVSALVLSLRYNGLGLEGFDAKRANEAHTTIKVGCS